MLGMGTKKQKSRVLVGVVDPMSGKYAVGQEVSWSIYLRGRIAFTKSGRVEEILDHRQYVVRSDTGAKYRVKELPDGTLGVGDVN